MQCFTVVEIHPQGPKQIAELARAEAHAETCAACGERLEALRAADADLAEGLTLVAAEAACPDPESLAAWVDDGCPVGRPVEAHLSGCFECRADLLECLSEDAGVAGAIARPGGSRSSRRGHVQGAGRPWVAIASAAAAILVVAGGLSLLSSNAESGERAQLRPSQPAPPAPVGSADLAKLPEPEPVAVPLEPRAPTGSDSPADGGPSLASEPADDSGEAEPTDVEPAPAVEPPADSTPAVESEVAPKPEATPGPEVTAEPEVTPEPAAEPTPPAAASEPGAALAVAQAQNVAIRLPGERRWQALDASSVPVGSELRAAGAGATLRAGRSLITLNTNARLTLDDEGALALTAGQVVLEGRGARLVAHDASVEVTGRALVEVSRKRYGLRVLAGRARVAGADGEPHDLDVGAALAATRGKRPRVKRGAAPDPTTLPPWARPRTRGGPRGPRNPRGPGAGPGQKPGSGPPRNPSPPRGSPRSPSPGSRR